MDILLYATEKQFPQKELEDLARDLELQFLQGNSIQTVDKERDKQKKPNLQARYKIIELVKTMNKVAPKGMELGKMKEKQLVQTVLLISENSSSAMLCNHIALQFISA